MGKKDGEPVTKEVVKRTLDLDRVIETPTKIVLRHRPDEIDMESVEMCKECSARIQKVKGKPMTVRSVCVEALMAALGKDEKVDGKKKLKNILFAEKLMNTTDMALTQDECVDLKRLVDKLFDNPTVVARTYQVLDPEGSAPDKLD